MIRPFGAKKADTRKYFSAQVKRDALEKYKNKCAVPSCRLSFKKIKPHYDHKNGKNWQVTLGNCQPLCPNCHSKKTSKEAGSKTRRRNIREGRKVSEARKPPSFKKLQRSDKGLDFSIKL